MTVIYPTSDSKNFPNVSDFFVVKEGMATEVTVVSLQPERIVVFERAVESDACGLVKWVTVFAECCGEVIMTSACQYHLFSLPGRYRAIILDISSGERVGITSANIGTDSLVAVQHEDASGMLGDTFPCCLIEVFEDIEETLNGIEVSATAIAENHERIADATECICEQTTTIATQVTAIAEDHTRIADATECICQNTEGLVPAIQGLFRPATAINSPDNTINVVNSGPETFQLTVNPEAAASAICGSLAAKTTLKACLGPFGQIVDNGDGSYTWTSSTGDTVTWLSGSDVETVIQELEEAMVYRIDTNTVDSLPRDGDNTTKYLCLKLQVPVDGVYAIGARARLDAANGQSDANITGAWLQISTTDTNGIGQGGYNIPAMAQYAPLTGVTGGLDQDAWIAPRTSSDWLYYPQAYPKVESRMLRLQAGQWVYFTIRARCEGPGGPNFIINNPELILARTLSAIDL